MAKQYDGEVKFDFSRALTSFYSRLAMLSASSNIGQFYDDQVNKFLRDIDRAMKKARKNLREAVRKKANAIRLLSTDDPECRSLTEWAYDELGLDKGKLSKNQARRKKRLKKIKKCMRAERKN